MRGAIYAFKADLGMVLYHSFIAISNRHILTSVLTRLHFQKNLIFRNIKRDMNVLCIFNA